MNQVVIAVGGRAERTRPVSDVIPKPLFEFGGRTFLFYLIEQFARRGARNFLLLTGYLEDQFEIEAKNISALLGVNVKTHFSNIENETGMRISEASHLLSDNFVFLYGDIYLPLKDEQLDFLLLETQLAFGVYQGAFRSDSCNVEIENENFRSYRKSSSSNFNAINCGYFLIQKKYLKLFNNRPVENIVLQEISQQINPKVLICRNKYYTTGDPERLSQTRNFLTSRPTILLDRDGTLIQGLGPGEFHFDFKNLKWKTGVFEFLRKMTDLRVQIVIITNQPAVGNEKLSWEKMLEINARINSLFLSNSIYVSAFFICHHGWGDSCECRKPAPGLFYEAQHWLDINWSSAIYIGDMDRDCEAATQVGCKFLRVNSSESVWPKNISNEVLKFFKSASK